MQASEMRRWAEDLDTALIWHLRSNHFPPIPLDNLPVAKEAIEKANAEEWEAMIYVPTAARELPVWRIVEGMHLETFLGPEERR